MKTVYVVKMCGVMLGVAGCTIRPLPVDVGDPTTAIIKKIRCEVQGALFDQVIELLQWSEKNQRGPLRVGLKNERISFDRATNELGKYLKENRELVKNLGSFGLPRFILDKRKNVIAIVPDNIAGRPLDSEADKIIQQYIETSIAYTFRFKVTETNNNTANANFSLPFSTGTFTLGLSAGNNRERINERTVDFADKFSASRNLDCLEKDRAINSDWVYPINGRVGMDEVINTYIELHWQISKSEGDFTSQTDKLTYTTTFTASAKPKIVLNPGGLNNLKLSQADLDLGAERIDVHEVQFTIKPRVPKKDPFVTTVKLKKGVVLQFTLPDGFGKVVKSQQPKKRKISRRPPKLRSYFRSLTEQDRTDLKNVRRELNRQIGLDRGRELRDLIE